MRGFSLGADVLPEDMPVFRQKPVHLERNSLQFLFYIGKKCANVTVEGEEELFIGTTEKGVRNDTRYQQIRLH